MHLVDHPSRVPELLLGLAENERPQRVASVERLEGLSERVTSNANRVVSAESQFGEVHFVTSYPNRAIASSCVRSPGYVATVESAVSPLASAGQMHTC